MIELIYLFLEILAIILCLHNFYGQKLRADIYTVTYIVFEVGFMMLVNYSIVSRETLPVVYILFILYALLEFKDKVIDTIIESLVAVLTVSVIQMLLYLPSVFIYDLSKNEDIIITVMNLVIFIIVFATKNMNIYSKISTICKRRELKVTVCILACSATLVYYLMKVKTSNIISMDVQIISAAFAMTVIYILMRWQKLNYEVELKEKQIEVSRMCNESLNHLIDKVRKNQHDFNNHLNAIYGMHMTIDNYEKLVKSQREYCEKIVDENRFNKILICIHEPILSGFIYYKACKIQEQGINFTYQVSVSSKKIDYISVFDLNEIIGILLDNAQEAVENSGLEKEIHIEIIEIENCLSVAVRNISPVYNNNDLMKFFKAGYSTKGKERGLGLAKIKDFQKRYKYDIFVNNKEIEDKNWLEFSIYIEK